MPPRTSNRRPVPLSQGQNQQLNADGSVGDFSESPLAARKLTIHSGSDNSGTQSRGLEYYRSGDPNVRFFIDTQDGSLNVQLLPRATTSGETLLDTAITLNAKYWDGADSENVRVILRAANTATTPTSAFTIAFIDDDETQAFSATVFTLTHDGNLTIAGNMTITGTLTFDGYAAPSVLTQYKDADETVNNSVSFQSDDDLNGSNFAINEIWAFRYVLIVTAGSATPDLKYRLNANAGAAAIYYRSNGYGTAGSMGDGYANASATSVAHTGAETDYQIVIEGVIVNGAVTGGGIDFQWTQNTATAVDTTVKKGSYVTFTRLV